MLWSPFLVTLTVGQVVMLGAASLSLMAPDRRGLLGWVPTLLLYWPLGAIAAYKAVLELIIAPFFWDKTTHGLSR
jgi:hypothetical protein